jgi:xylulose-5-phosphate/fructose-6-phosphate phosphoketolase
MGANPNANRGLLLKDLQMPDFNNFDVHAPSPEMVSASDTTVLGKLLRDVVQLNEDNRNFRIFGPDETLYNKLDAIFEATDR